PHGVEMMVCMMFVVKEEIQDLNGEAFCQVYLFVVLKVGAVLFEYFLWIVFVSIMNFYAVIDLFNISYRVFSFCNWQ
ncbi:hypothetical protein NPN23_24145, partial [Vibrio parahaemolyticus]|nr:hypothetical protein [Vibrio parahaemolyticus]